MTDTQRNYLDLLESYGCVEKTQITFAEYLNLPIEEKKEYTRCYPDDGLYCKREVSKTTTQNEAEWFITLENFSNIKKTQKDVRTIKNIAVFYLIAFLVGLIAVIPAVVKFMDLLD